MRNNDSLHRKFQGTYIKKSKTSEVDEGIQQVQRIYNLLVKPTVYPNTNNQHMDIKM